MKKTKIAAYLIFFMLAISIALADTDDFTDAKKIIEQKTPCSKLTESQLETLGDYYMELMHPGELHERMELMMGGEGSESLKAAHIAMANRFYCLNESADYGMGIMRGSMMRNGMIGTYDYAPTAYRNYKGGGMTDMMLGNWYGMMGSYGYMGFNGFLVTILLIGLIVLVYLWIAKLWRDQKKK